MELPFFSFRRLRASLYLINMSIVLLCYGAGVFAQSVVQAGNASGEHKQATVSLDRSVGLNASQDEAPYPFKKGDAFRLIVSPDTAHFLNGIFQIDDDGIALFPIIGKVRVDNLSEKKLTAFLDSQYLSYLRYPNVRVQPLIRVAMLGGFFRPGMYYLSPTSSLWDALAQAGGPVREDGLKKIHWERSNVVLKENLLPDIEAGVSLSKIGITSGDQLWVTHVVKRDGWEIFQTEVIPVLSISVTAMSAAATLYFSYQAYNNKGK
jgi:protein involved in polysaccharide export with SLBB domain